MKNLMILCAMLTLSSSIAAQNNQFPTTTDFTELTDTKPHDNEAVWNKLPATLQFSWGNTNVRYPKLSIPDVTKSIRWQTDAWKGERINAQAVLWTKTNIEDVTVNVSDLKNGSTVIPSSAITTNFVRYVMTDELNKDRKGACGGRANKAEWDSSIVADMLDIIKVRDIKARTTQPVWVNIWVPQDAKAGKYKGTLTVSGKDIAPVNLQIEVNVLNRTLPAPKDWAFHLDLWQNPYAVARFYNVPLWSKEHFDAMRPVMKMLADAGQKIITTSIMHKPWAGQTEDHFDSMVFRMKNLDGSWTFDYTIFDKWVEYMMNEIGIDQQINCYTMIPWALKFDYFDQATNRIQFVEAKPGEADYEDYWGSFLKDFSRHLRQKGWFDKTTIAMDERGLEAMQEAIKVIRNADPEFKISLAGNYHKEIEPELYDYCLGYGNNFPADIKATREKAGKISTVYTCCAEPFPNTFTFSAPAEATWIGWHAMAGNYDGYLRWAYNSWTADPLRDSRFRTWAAGDCYIVYPERSSIRMEHLIEGIQDYEKIRILREELATKNNKSKLDKLNKLVSQFTPEGLAETQKDPTAMVEEARKVLNSF
ncbi:DUF4091 domain-containing protein [Parabacteroides chinchillae]|uniref:Glycoside hydrolase 123 C-terminal domain-containing protein n=1 Tax=Parabacteroides chinchillae TaxID=871327 RepID=A0A8G2BXT7_9BACT|nr:DUF4091 domain-containing protein [Parabacteroides chinchillae]SEG09254.1 protein of unknown function [Parabacteroides chinchillae]